MQIRCYHCHKPYAINKETIHTALDYVTAENMSHYNVPCPHCRRVNMVSRQELQRAAPDWKAPAQEPPAEE
jgi:phage FluMu protein Com